MTGRLGGVAIEISGLSWRPASRSASVFAGLDLRISAGQRVLVTGPSGSGKSTLLRAIAGVLLSAGHGELAGSITIGGVATGTQPGRACLLTQDPTASLVAELVGRDVAFGLENRRVPRVQIWRRVDQALGSSAFPYPRTHAVAALSGGEIQRLALAGSLVLDSDVLLLDEPTSMLDPVAARQVRAAVLDDVSRRGATLIVVDHQIEPWLDEVDRLVVLAADGSIAADGDPARVIGDHGRGLAAQGVWIPGVALPARPKIDPALVTPFRNGSGSLVSAAGVTVTRSAGPADRRLARSVAAIDGVDCTFEFGRCLAIAGTSGAGKSTLLGVLAGLTRPTSGRVTSTVPGGRRTQRQGNPRRAWRLRRRGADRELWQWDSRRLAGLLTWTPQRPEVGFVSRTVTDELLATSRAVGTDMTAATRRAEGLLETFGLSRYASTSPYHLSGGEQRRLAIAAALVHAPCGVLLDEPTVGQDSLTWSTAIAVLEASRDAGTGVALATHDRSAIEALADTTLRLVAGRRSRDDGRGG